MKTLPMPFAKKAIILSLFATLPLIAVLAQHENIPLVTVVGESVIKAKPDYVIIGLKIERDLATDKTGQVRPAFEIFTKQDSHIALFDFDERNINESLIQTEKSIFYKEIFIKITDLTKLDKYLLELYNLGFKKYTFFEYRLNSSVEYKNQAQKEAINSARAKAEMLANEMHQLIGKAHTIEELECETINWYTLTKRDGTKIDSYTTWADSYSVEPTYITLALKIKVSFDLIK